MLSFISPFFFNDTATTEIYTLSLHDALPISLPARRAPLSCRARRPSACAPARGCAGGRAPRRRRGHGGRHRQGVLRRDHRSRRPAAAVVARPLALHRGSPVREIGRAHVLTPVTL